MLPQCYAATSGFNFCVEEIEEVAKVIDGSVKGYRFESHYQLSVFIYSFSPEEPWSSGYSGRLWSKRTWV